MVGFLTVLLVKADVRLAKVFGSNMVLQRDTLVSLWGWGDPGEKVSVRIGTKQYKTQTANNGKWKVAIGPFEAGGPYTLTVTGKNKVVMENVVFGEVWLCGGQSNMQFTLRMLGKKVEDIPDVENDKIRLFQAALDTDYLPKEDLKFGIWKTASGETVPDFSATAYFFGKLLYDSLRIPIGLVSINLGATAIETWMSAQALRPFPQFRGLIDRILKRNKSFEQLTEELSTYRKDWDNKYYLKGPGFDEEWYRPGLDLSDWKSITVPNFWEYEGLDHDGAVWFRKEFDLPRNFRSDSFQINLNQIDDYDITWVNGHKVGETFGNRNWRNYKVPVKILKPTDNELVVRVFDIGGLGGFHTAAFWGNPILLGDWKYKPGLKIEADKFPVPEVPNGSLFSYPTLLYNGNIAPITSLSIKGAIWYQGEANVQRASEYARLLPAMIRDWRKQWGYAFPFLIVQLGNYGKEPEDPVESSWAELREAQQLALREPNTFLVTAIDIGEAEDIHPKNKEEVGRRLGHGVLELAYGREQSTTSPTFDQMTLRDSTIEITFSHIGSGIVTKNKYGYIRGFQVAGGDRKFYWARAILRGDRIILSCPQVKQPKAVRYAWADNPGPLDLYSKEGLPVLPFRTDNWPQITKGAVYHDHPHQF